MEVRYRTKKLERICKEGRLARRLYGAEMERKIFERIEDLQMVSSIEALLMGRIGRCHPLKGDREEEYAMDLVGGYRLIFQQYEGYIEIVMVNSIEDYH